MNTAQSLSPRVNLGRPIHSDCAGEAGSITSKKTIGLKSGDLLREPMIDTILVSLAHKPSLPEEGGVREELLQRNSKRLLQHYRHYPNQSLGQTHEWEVLDERPMDLPAYSQALVSLDNLGKYKHKGSASRVQRAPHHNGGLLLSSVQGITATHNLLILKGKHNSVIITGTLRCAHVGSQAAICGGVVFTKVNDSKYRDGRQGSSESLNDENYRDRDQRATSLDGSKLRVSLDISDAGLHNTGTVTYLSRGRLCRRVFVEVAFCFSRTWTPNTTLFHA